MVPCIFPVRPFHIVTYSALFLKEILWDLMRSKSISESERIPLRGPNQNAFVLFIRCSKYEKISLVVPLRGTHEVKCSRQLGKLAHLESNGKRNHEIVWKRVKTSAHVDTDCSKILWSTISAMESSTGVHLLIKIGSLGRPPVALNN